MYHFLTSLFLSIFKLSIFLSELTLTTKKLTINTRKRDIRNFPPGINICDEMQFTIGVNVSAVCAEGTDTNTNGDL